MITVSIVSHGHGAMIDRLVSQLQKCPEVRQIILTLNIPELSEIRADGLVSLIVNSSPKGFGANHNAAFIACRETFYCVLNPDIELSGNPFPALLQCLEDRQVALVAPLILTPDGVVEDSARYFPTLWSLLRKVFVGQDGRYASDLGRPIVFPDWVAGMFMLFRSASFEQLGGFDERYFLYYEDVDICRRIGQAGMQVGLCPSVSAIHDARRDSHRSLPHLRWHLASMTRYLTKSR